ncbi:hypothetical protein SprV_0301188600 [Sparganum proliferum]
MSGENKSTDSEVQERTQTAGKALKAAPLVNKSSELAQIPDIIHSLNLVQYVQAKGVLASEVATPTQLQLSQHAVDAEDSRPFQYISVGDSILPTQPQDATKTTEVEVVQSACLLRVHCSSLRSVQQRRQDDGPVHLPLRAELETVTIPNCALKAAEGLTGFRNPAGHFVIDFGATGEGTAQVGEVLHHLQLGSVHADLRRRRRRVGGSGCVGWRLMHDHCLLRVNNQTEVLADGGEEDHAPLHLLFRGGVQGAVVGEEKFVNGGCGYA